MAVTNTVQTDFAGRCDNGTESGATWKYANGTCGDTAANAKNRDWTQAVDEVFRVRFQLTETNNKTALIEGTLYYNHNGGGYTAVGAGTPIQYAASAQSITDGDPTTEQFAGAGTFVAGEYSEDAVVAGITLKNTETEVEYCLTIDSAQVADTDTILLQVRDQTATLPGGYTNTPTITVAEGAAAVDVDCTLGTVAIAGNNATIVEGIDVACTLGTITLVGYIAEVEEGIGVSCTTGALTVVGYNATVIEGIDVSASVGTVTVVGSNATVVEGIDVACTLGAVAILGYNADVTNIATIDVDCTLGTITLAGLNATVIEGIDVACTLGTTTVDGFNASVIEGIDVACTLGTTTVDGFNATVIEGIDVACTLGTITLAGLNATVIEGIDVACTLGAVAILGYNADVTNIATIDVDCTLGTITLAGFNASVIEGIDVACTLGTVAILGYNADVTNIATIDVDCTLGTVAILGNNATVLPTIVVNCTLGTTAIAGYKAVVTEGIGVACTLGTTTVDGLNASVIEGIDVACTLGTTTIAGYKATVIGGGGSSAEIADGDKAGDATTAALAALADLAEGGEAGDTVAASLTALAVSLEGAETGDTLIAMVAVLAAIAEGAKAGDAPTAALSALAALGEGAKAGDAPTAALSALAAIAEGAKAGDAPTAALSALAAIAEGDEAGDTFTAALSALAALGQGAKAGDTFTAIVTVLTSLASVIEIAKAGDALAGVVTALADVAEGIKAGDSPLASLTALAAIVSGTKAGDTFTGIATTPAEISEGTSAGDVLAALVTIATILTDPIAVDQPPGGGNDYPFVASHSLSGLIADIYLAYRDDASDYVPPFRIRWLYGFGSVPVAPPFTPVHTYDMLIEDRTGAVVFDSRDADAPTVNLWSDRFRVIQWVNGDSILRAVQRLVPSRPFGSYIGANLCLDFLTYAQLHALTPEQLDILALTCPFGVILAELNTRAVQRVPSRVRSLRVDLGSQLQSDVVLSNGYNTLLEVLDAAPVDGTRNETEIRISARAASGDGRYGPACGEDSVSPVRALAGVSPDACGNFMLDAEDCFRVERPITQVLAAGPPRELKITDHTLQLFGDCGICCECQDFMDVYEGIRRMRDRYADMITRTQATRDEYASMVTRFEAQAACRSLEICRGQVSKLGSGVLGFSAGCTHNGVFVPQGCVSNVVLVISFDYLDTTGNMEPGIIPPTPLAANTTYAGTPTITANSVFRSGNFVTGPNGIGSPAPFHSYQIGGAWPHYYVTFDAINVGDTGSVVFHLNFPGAVSTDLVEFIVDAYSVVAPEEGGGGIPIPGYTPGSGPTGAAAVAAHIAPNPTKISAAILGTTS